MAERYSDVVFIPSEGEVVAVGNSERNRVELLPCTNVLVTLPTVSVGGTERVELLARSVDEMAEGFVNECEESDKV